MKPLLTSALAAAALLLLACPAETPPAPAPGPTPEPGRVEPASQPAEPPRGTVAEKEEAPKLDTTAPPGDRSAAGGWSLYAQLDIKVRDWRFGLVEKKEPAPAAPQIEAAMQYVGLGQLKPELDKLKSGESVTLSVVPSEVWDHPGVLTDVHTALTEYGQARGLQLNLGEAIIPVHGIDSIRGDFEVICMEARNAKGDEAGFIEKTRKGVVNVRVTKAFREATEMPVGERAAHLYAVANDEAKRRWRCAELETLWPPSEAAKQKIADLDKAPASQPTHPAMPARQTGPSSQPAK